MALGSYPVPGLFGGVSQQIPALRHPTHCEDQVNFLSTTVQGTYKRPGTRHIASRTGIVGSQQVAGSAVHCHIIDKGDGARFALLLSSGALVLYSLEDGSAQPVDFPHGTSYLTCVDPSLEFRCVTVADYTFIVNRLKVPALGTATAPANPASTHYVNIRTAAAGVFYKVLINGIAYTYGSDQNPTQAEIAGGLRAALAAGLPAYTVLVMPGTNMLKIIGPAPFTCTVTDGWGNTGLVCVSNGVPLYSDLPARFETGFTVTVQGSADSSADPYYVKWDGSKWVETVKPGALLDFDVTTMPHMLIRKADGTWSFERNLKWASRKVGDDTTNPVPSFIGTSINNVFFYRNRLGLLAGDAVVLSRAGDFWNYWGASATQVLATDPIDLAASTETVENLEWAVQYNSSLLVWGRARQQFALTGGDVLTPETARLQPSTSLEVNPEVRPEAVGNKVLFTAPAGAYSRVNLLRVSKDTVTSEADDITSHVPEYVTGSPRQLAVSGTFKAVVVLPKGATGTFEFLKYDEDANGQLSQKAWQRFTLGIQGTCTILKGHWVGRTLYLVLHVVNPQGASSYAFEALDFEASLVDYTNGIQLHLDRRVLASVSGTTVDIPYTTGVTPKVFQCIPGYEPTELVVQARTDLNTVSSRLTLAATPATSQVVVGLPYPAQYTFTECFMRDRDSNPVLAATVKLVRLRLRYVSTGDFTASVQALYRPAYTYPMVGRNIGNPYQGATRLGLSDGTFSVPIQAKAEGTKVSISSTSHLPTCIPFAEWVADVTMKAQR